MVYIKDYILNASKYTQHFISYYVEGGLGNFNLYFKIRLKHTIALSNCQILVKSKKFYSFVSEGDEGRKVI